MPEPLSDLERRILDYLIDFLRRNTYQPSIREIGRRFDIKSTKTVSEHLQSLDQKGWISRDPSRSRGIRLLGADLAPDTVTVPFFGGAVADGVTLARDGAVEEYQIDRRLAGASGTFLLAMVGDTLVDIGIYDGDLLLIEPVPQEELESGDVAVVRRSGEAEVTRYVVHGGDVALEPANSEISPTFVRDAGEVDVMGRVVGVFRRLRDTAARPAGAAVEHAAPGTTS